MTAIDTASLSKEIAPIVKAAAELRIVDLDSAQKAADLRSAIKTHHKRVKEFFSPHKKRADELHAALCADEKKAMAESNQALLIIDSGLVAYKNNLDLIGSETRKIDGLHFRQDFDVKVTDITKLIKSCARGKTSLAFLTLDDIYARDFAKRTGGNVTVPGVEITPKNVPVGR